MDDNISGYYRDEFGRLARFYDFGLRFMFRFAGGETIFRNEIIAAAGIGYGERVLDVNCGTGTLALLIAARVSGEGSVAGVDLSHEMIAMARAKSQQGNVEFIEANAERLPFADVSFDCVTISLAYHEMNREGRRNALAEIMRVLRPGGRLAIADLRAPDTFFTRVSMRVLRLWETDTLTDMWERGVGRELEQAGFSVTARRITGRRFLEIHAAVKPA